MTGEDLSTSTPADMVARLSAKGPSSAVSERKISLRAAGRTESPLEHGETMSDDVTADKFYGNPVQDDCYLDPRHAAFAHPGTHSPCSPIARSQCHGVPSSSI
jgi:hypothetical protein